MFPAGRCRVQPERAWRGPASRSHRVPSVDLLGFMKNCREGLNSCKVTALANGEFSYNSEPGIKRI